MIKIGIECWKQLLIEMLIQVEFSLIAAFVNPKANTVHNTVDDCSVYIFIAKYITWLQSSEFARQRRRPLPPPQQHNSHHLQLGRVVRSNNDTHIWPNCRHLIVEFLHGFALRFGCGRSCCICTEYCEPYASIIYNVYIFIYNETMLCIEAIHIFCVRAATLFT